MKKIALRFFLVPLLIPAITVAADMKLKGAVYAPVPGVICDKKAGFCADHEGISLALTKEYLGEKAQAAMMKRINDAGAGNYDTTWFVLSNGVSCKTKETLCTVSKYADKINSEHTRALFGTLP
jgi:hypothetical protein